MKTKLPIIACLITFFHFSSSGVVKTSITNGNWNTAATWSPAGAPAPNDKVLIYHEVILNVNFSANDTVFVYGVLSIGNNRTLDLTPGTMVLINNSQYNGRLGTIGSNGKINGNYHFQKYIQRCDGYSTYGSPFTAAVSSFNWYSCNQCMGTWSNIHYYDETAAGTLDIGYTDQTGGTLARGKGFFYWFSNYNGDKNFPRTIALTGSTDFSQVFDFGITYTNNGIAVDNGFNLLANPFPGTIDWESLAWTKKKTDNAIYVWNSCTGSYSSYSGGVGVNGGSRYIPSMQGFWVHASTINPVLKVQAQAMVIDGQQMLRTGDESPDRVLRITLGEDEIAIRMDDHSTVGFDPETDAVVMLTEKSRLYTSVGTAQYAINAVDASSICLDLHTRRTGSLLFNGCKSFPASYVITLVDNQTGEVTPITDSTFYDFTDTSEVAFSNRFRVCIQLPNVTGQTQQLLSTEPVKLTGFPDHIILTTAENKSNAKVQAYTLSGELIYSGETRDGKAVINTQGMPVFIRVSSESGTWSRKVLGY